MKISAKTGGDLLLFHPHKRPQTAWKQVTAEVLSAWCLWGAPRVPVPGWGLHTEWDANLLGLQREERTEMISKQLTRGDGCPEGWLMPREWNQTQRPCIIWWHLYEISRREKFIEIDRKWIIGCQVLGRWGERMRSDCLMDTGFFVERRKCSGTGQWWWFHSVMNVLNVTNGDFYVWCVLL